MIASDREQISKQCHRFLVIDSALKSQGVELCQLRVGTVLTGQSRGLPQKIDRRIERRIGMVRRTLKLNPLVTLIGEAVRQTTGHSRFSDAGLTTEEQDLSFAVDGFTPAAQQE